MNLKLFQHLRIIKVSEQENIQFEKSNDLFNFINDIKLWGINDYWATPTKF